MCQAAGPCLVNVYPDGVDVRVSRSYREAVDGEALEGLWRCCALLADQAECAVFPQYDDDDPVDMSLEVAEARRVHDWA